MKYLLVTSLFILTSCYRPPPSQQSCNFVISKDSQRLHWNKEFPIKLHIDDSVPEIAYPAINRAVMAFNDVIKDHQVFVFADDSYATIYWRNTWNRAIPNEEAVTTLNFIGSEIYKATIEVDAYNFSFNYDYTDVFIKVDLESLMIHELGHVLGLAHINSSGSVMYPTLNSGEIRRELGIVDINDLECGY